MKKQIQSWQLAKDSLEQNIPVILMYVLQSLGSSPGRNGFFMIVNKQGEMRGSLGGGIMEHKFVEMAKIRMKENNKSAKTFKQVHDKAASNNQSGMICSGEQTIFFYPMKNADVICLKDILSSLEKNENGMLELTDAGIVFKNVIPKQNFYFNQKNANEFIYKEKTGYKNELHIIGGGHCALALSNLMSSMDFYIHVYDDRQDLNTMLQNKFAHQKHVIDSYEHLNIKEGENVYVVIMTFGYRTDDLALRTLMNKNFRYTGLLGSSKKIEKMFAAYKEEGLSSVWLKKIHSPIGLDIKSQTPEEIAISIAAEIIREKNNNQ